MTTGLYKKGLVLGIIGLFIGSSIVSGVYLKYYGKNGENISIEYKLEKNIGNFEIFYDNYKLLNNNYDQVSIGRLGFTSFQECYKKDGQETLSNKYNIGYCVQQTNDEGYIVCGGVISKYFTCTEGFLIKTDSYGDEIWNKTYLVKGYTIFYSMDQTSDDGYIMTGQTYDGFNDTNNVFLLKTDEQGNKIWDKTYDMLEPAVGIRIRQTNDGGNIIAGVTGDDSNIFLIKTDNLGLTIWVKTYDFYKWAEWVDVQQTSDGGCIIGGTVGEYWNESSALLLKTDEYGNELWNKTFNVMDGTVGYSVLQIGGDGYIIAGYTVSSSYQDINMMIIKTDVLGNEDWRKTYEESAGFSIEQTSDNGFIIGGAAFIQEKWNALLLKTDKNGNKIWSRSYSGLGESYSMSVIQTNDKGYILTGVTAESLSSDFNQSALLLKTDDIGNQQWYKGFNVATVNPGFVKICCWDVSDSIYRLYIKIGNHRISVGSSSPLGYYETPYIALCPGDYSYSIEWFGRESTCNFTGYVNVSEGEYKDVRQNLTFCDDIPEVEIVKPDKAIYILNKSLIPFFIPIVIGDIQIKVNAYDLSSGIRLVDFYVDDELLLTDEVEPYCMQWDEKLFGKHNIEVVAFDNVDYHSSENLTVWKFF